MNGTKSLILLLMAPISRRHRSVGLGATC